MGGDVNYSCLGIVRHTPLYMAIKKGHLKKIEVLLEFGANVGDQAPVFNLDIVANGNGSFQLSDHIGQVISHLEKKDLLEDTIIVFTSDHGDYLGDHWLGEKDIFHEASVRVPFIICDPSKDADQTRG